MYINQELLDIAFDTVRVGTNSSGYKEKRILLGTVFCEIDKYGTYLSVDRETGNVYAVRPTFERQE